jgi:hypothetical protein
MIKKIIFIGLFCLATLAIYGQEPIQTERDKLIWDAFALSSKEFKNLKDSTNKLITKHFSVVFPDLKQVKDTVDFLSFAIEIQVVKHGDSTEIKNIAVNDTSAYILYKNFDFLRYINFSAVLKDRKEAILIIPVGIIVGYVSYPGAPRPMIQAGFELVKKIGAMFNYRNRQTEDFIYLNPSIFLTEARRYD